ncbi:hypothetical protein LUZ61_002293 [Rhynchospora tenuis]|uniref:F-box domain-containing protein n=1 Tax=Rhynchospora tenuis TaxID=198213 RepID=A0AAD5ZIT1_9POAL|nr:hypothetical protein LUZ61_002293 [Rhynchospora tenuis]
MGKSKGGKQKKEFDTMSLSRFVLCWEESALLKRRKWSKLPSDILLMIFEKMGPIEVLTKAIRLCRDWLEVARNEPLLWRKVDMTCHGKKFGPNYLQDIACIAVNWSAGQLEEFAAEQFGSDDLLQCIANSTSNLKRISFIKCNDISEDVLEKTIKRWHLLEEIELYFWMCSRKFFRAIGLSCPYLKCLRLNYIRVNCRNDKKDCLAKLIGRNFPNLSSLQLIGNKMTNKGLHFIFKGCPQLESLDIRQCYKLTIDQSLQSDLERIKNVRLPNDSIDDYKFACYLKQFSYSSLLFDNSENDSVSGGDFDSDSDTMNYLDIKYEHIMFQDW